MALYVQELSLPLCVWGNVNACVCTRVQDRLWVFGSVGDLRCMWVCSECAWDSMQRAPMIVCRGDAVQLGYFY